MNDEPKLQTPDERATQLELDIVQAIYVSANATRLVSDVRHEVIVRAIRAIERAAYQRSAELACGWCFNQTKVVRRDDGGWEHVDNGHTYRCTSSAIRCLMARAICDHEWIDVRSLPVYSCSYCGAYSAEPHKPDCRA